MNLNKSTNLLRVLLYLGKFVPPEYLCIYKEAYMYKAYQFSHDSVKVKFIRI